MSRFLRRAAVFAVLAAAALPVFSLNLPLKPAPADPASRAAIMALLADTAASWDLGFAELDVSRAGAASASLGLALPRLWLQGFPTGLDHRYDDAARRDIAERIRRRELVKAGEALSKALEDRDLAWLSGKDSAASRTQAAAAIDAARRRYQALAGLDPVWIPIARSKPVRMVGAEGAAGQTSAGGQAAGSAVADPAVLGLFPAVATGAEPSAALAKKLQALVHGSLELESGYLILRLSLWDFGAGRAVWGDEWVLDPLQALDRAGEQRLALAAAVRGGPAGGLELQVSPTDAVASLRRIGEGGEPAGEVLRAPGGGRWDGLEPGRYELDVELAGHAPRTETVEVPDGDVVRVSVALVPREPSQVRLESDPPGARVYRDNRYAGVTPLVLPLSGRATTVVLELEGYRSGRIVLPADTAAEAASAEPQALPAVRLVRDIVGWQVETSLRRDRFFDALGAFAVSIVPPLFFNGLYRNIVGTLPATNSAAFPVDTWNRLARDGNMFYYLTFASAAVTAILGVNAGIQLSDYLFAADMAAGGQPGPKE